MMVYVDGKRSADRPTVYRRTSRRCSPATRIETGQWGVPVLDTTLLSTGLHTIVWTATDSGGFTEGLAAGISRLEPLGPTRATDSAEQARHGGGGQPGGGADADHRGHGPARLAPGAVAIVPAAAVGSVLVHGEELDRFELQLGHGAGKEVNG